MSFLVLLMALPVRAQMSIGVIGGVNFANVDVNSDGNMD